MEEKQDKQKTLETLFVNHLQNINGIVFTRREIGTIACLLAGRSTKKIAQIFSIAPRTIESHLRNIMQKLQCHSKEAVIDFIEKSGKLEQFKIYHSNLINSDINSDNTSEFPLIEEETPKPPWKIVGATIDSNISFSTKILKIINRSYRRNMIIISSLFLIGLMLVFLQNLGYISFVDFKKINSKKVLNQNFELSLNDKLYWNLPRQDHLFVNRETLLNHINTMTQKMNNKIHNKGEDSKSHILALTGLGGIGKTQLALQFAYHSKYPYFLRAWFQAENLDELNQKYFEFAKRIGYPREDFNIKEIIPYVKQWLVDHPGWLFVFDNVNSYEEIAPYLPEFGGQIIITTRSQLWPNEVQIIPVGLMTENESVTLIKKLVNRSSVESETDKISQLVKLLDYLPLALAQAGAYIHHNQISVSEYLVLYNKYFNDLLKDPSLPKGTHGLPVAITWNTTLHAILKKEEAEEAKLAIHLLTACSYLSPDNISRSLLLSWLTLFKPDLANPEIMLPKLIGILWKYSLISIEDNGDISIHRLVQLTQRQKIQKITLNWYNTLLHATHSEFTKEINPRTDEIRQRELLPHLQSLANYAENSWTSKELSSLLLEDILHDIGNALDKGQCAFKTARPYYEKALTFALAKYPANHINLANIFLSSGQNLRNLRNYHKAVSHLERAWQIYESNYGKDHLLVGKTLSSLGHAYRNIKEVHKSREVLERALKITEKYYHRNHIKLAPILTNLGDTYRILKEYDKSFEVFSIALNTFEREYGKNHRLTIPTIVGIAATCRETGELQKSIENFEFAKNFYENYYGKTHPYVTITYMNLGESYLKQGNYEKAKTLFEIALQQQIEEYGNENPHLAITFQFLGETYENLKKHDIAKEYREKARILLQKELAKKIAL